MKFEIEYCYEKLNLQWDNFVKESNSILFQTSAWANYEFFHFGWKSMRCYFKNNESIFAGFQITIINDDLLGNIGVIRSGPCFKNKTLKIMDLIVKEMKKSIQTLNLSYLIVTPDYGEHDLIQYLESEKFESRFPNLPPFNISSTKTTTLFLDLMQSDDEILKQMSSMRRRGIKKGLNSPFKVRLGSREDLKVYYDLYNFTVRKHKYIDPVTNLSVDYFPSKESLHEVQKMWDELSPYEWIKLFLGTVDEEIICGALVFPFGKIFRYANWGWNLKYGEYHISDAMQWEMIQWAKTNGFHYYDFWEIDLKVAEAYKSNEPIPEALKATDFYGPTIFKMNFGGEIMKSPGVYVYYSNKMKHLRETSSDELTRLLKNYKDFHWAKKNFFRDRQAFFHLSK